MRDTALCVTKITHGGRQVNQLNAFPGQSHHRFGIEVKPPHATAFPYHAQQRRHRIDAEAKQRVADGTQGFNSRKDVAKPSPGDAQPWRIGPEHGAAHDNGIRRRNRGVHESGNAMRRVLAVRIHDQGMSEPA